VRLTPRSSRDAIDGVETDAAGRVYLKARVRAVPEDGAANTALCLLVAKALGVPKSAVSIVSGSASRLKTVRVEGEAEALQVALAQVIADSG
jgi:hypothetical protein